MTTTAAAKTESTSKYKFLSPNFFRGTAKGQINSVFNDRSERPEKVVEYQAALAAGDASLGDTITRQQAKKLIDLGIEIPESVKVSSPRRATAADEK